MGNAVEDGGGIRDGRRVGSGSRDEMADDEVVLFEAFADYLGVDLMEVGDGFAELEKGNDGRQRMRASCTARAPEN